VRGQLGSSKAMLLDLVKLVEEHNIKPVVGEIFVWGDAPKAFNRMLKQGIVGKLVISI
jgi:D-arabinose 1-dehydrogenase-like Zn-dependent alcohol dehydrogenase